MLASRGLLLTHTFKYRQISLLVFRCLTVSVLTLMRVMFHHLNLVKLWHELGTDTAVIVFYRGEEGFISRLVKHHYSQKNNMNIVLYFSITSVPLIGHRSCISLS